ncbi:Sushi, von Willebrand factor type A, EGF and pentraxin domain-containing protein 1 [Nymphon striatum]|nr:Sushi, von Willebrand factor type A, EGF and pentraxin domain-containing protein 1 [Nymphon striatum]
MECVAGLMYEARPEQGQNRRWLTLDGFMQCQRQYKSKEDDHLEFIIIKLIVFIFLFTVLNVATGKAPMHTSTMNAGISNKAVDGSTSTFYNPSTCSLTKREEKPMWYVNLLEPYMVQLVRVDFGKSCCRNNTPATIVLRVGKNRPDMKENPICNKFEGYIEEGRPLFLPCNPPMPGIFVSVTMEKPKFQQLSICETFVYTDQALPIERCPSFRDQPLGSTATYSGKCYIFYKNLKMNFENAKSFCERRGGSLVDETSAGIQGFLSWELWRRRRNDNDQTHYWNGVLKNNRNAWQWINGKEARVTFWTDEKIGNGTCSMFNSTAGWMWSDYNCNRRLSFVCQHKPKTCGKPEQPTNSTLLARNYNVGTSVEYRCAPGHLLVGPQSRTCMADGFYSEYPPKCKYLECPIPFPVTNGEYRLLNGTMTYKSVVQYTCAEGYLLRGRKTLTCDVNQKWNGPPPRCERKCNQGYNLLGKPKTMCLSTGSWDSNAPICKGKELEFTEEFCITSWTEKIVIVRYQILGYKYMKITQRFDDAISSLSSKNKKKNSKTIIQEK